jgi:hypothetical protein
MILYSSAGAFEYDLLVSPGAATSEIRFSFDCTEPISIDASGDLVIRSASSVLRQKRPHAYQESDGSRRDISAAYPGNRPVYGCPVFGRLRQAAGTCGRSCLGVLDLAGRTQYL